MDYIEKKTTQKNFSPLQILNQGLCLHFYAFSSTKPAQYHLKGPYVFLLSPWRPEKSLVLLLGFKSWHSALKDTVAETTAAPEPRSQTPTAGGCGDEVPEGGVSTGGSLSDSALQTESPPPSVSPSKT